MFFSRVTPQVGSRCPASKRCTATFERTKPLNERSLGSIWWEWMHSIFQRTLRPQRLARLRFLKSLKNRNLVPVVTWNFNDFLVIHVHAHTITHIPLYYIYIYCECTVYILVTNLMTHTRAFRCVHAEAPV